MLISYSLIWCIATAIPPTELVQQVQQTYLRGGDMEAKFAQTYNESLRHKQRIETGYLWVKQDGRVRWSYLVPTRKDFVFDGNTAFFYEPESAQVTVFERFGDSPLAAAMEFLWGRGQLSARFDITACPASCPAAVGTEVALLLTPKEPLSAVDHVVLMVDPRARRVRRSLVYDPLGNMTEYAFDDVRFGGNVPAAKFQFKAPPGVSLLRATADGSLGDPARGTAVAPLKPPTAP